MSCLTGPRCYINTDIQHEVKQYKPIHKLTYCQLWLYICCICRCCLTIFLKVFWPWDNYFLQFSHCDPWKVFSHSNYPPHGALGRYRDTSSFRQFHYIFCWLEFLNYCPDVGNGNFHCSSSFLEATSLICEAQFSFAAHRKDIFLVFSHCNDGWLREFGLCLIIFYLYFCETGSHGWKISFS